MEKSIELIHLEYLSRRQIILDDTKKWKLRRLTSGYKGEAEFLLWYKKYGSKHAKLVSNYWFHEGKTMESDVLVMTDDLWCTVDVKNFDGFFEYKNEACYINGHLLDENFFHTMSTRVRKLQRIAGEVSKNIKVIGAMVFINETVKYQLIEKSTLMLSPAINLRIILSASNNTSRCPII